MLLRVLFEPPHCSTHTLVLSRVPGSTWWEGVAGEEGLEHSRERQARKGKQGKQKQGKHLTKKSANHCSSLILPQCSHALACLLGNISYLFLCVTHLAS